MFQSKIAVSFVIMLTFAFGLLLGFFAFRTINEADLLNPQRTENKRYLSNELILSGSDKNKHTFFVHLLLNRKQTSLGGFTHYYTYEVIADQKTFIESFDAVNSSDSVLSSSIVSNLVITPSEDLSTRESYAFTLHVGEEQYEIITSQFEGDFIIKNSIDYTRYVSVGNATVTNNRSSIEVNAVLINSYAEDYSKYVFFEGYDQLDSTTHVLAVWDSANNFYFIDQSKTKSVQPNYQSHTWVLFKSRLSEMKKSFNTTISHQLSDKNPKKWDISIPDFDNAKLQIEVDYYSKTRAAGTVLGKITTSTGTRTLHGYAIYAEY